MSDQFQQQSFYEHLTDLRRMLVRVAWILAVGFGVAFIFREQIFNILRAPIAPYLTGNGLVFTAPTDKFVAYLKTCFLAAVLVTSPFWLYQLWLFIVPALYKHEKKYASYFIFFGTILFSLGACFVYFFVFPMAFEYLLNFGGTTDKPMITINEYLEFFVVTTLVFGAAFEMPLVLVIFGMMGIIDDEFLRTRRRMAIMALAVLSAVITPPDALSMLALLVPMVFLYELSIVLVKFLKPRPATPSA
jgi:sec-independent protein translocase protein TatC